MISPGSGGLSLISDLINHLQPQRQLKTNAHPLVEITVMNQPAKSRTLLHFVNLSGHSSSAYHPPIVMQNIEIQIQGKFTNAQTAAGTKLRTTTQARYTHLTLTKLETYEAVILT